MDKRISNKTREKIAERLFSRYIAREELSETTMLLYGRGAGKNHDTVELLKPYLKNGAKVAIVDVNSQPFVDQAEAFEFLPEFKYLRSKNVVYYEKGEIHLFTERNQQVNYLKPDIVWYNEAGLYESGVRLADYIDRGNCEKKIFSFTPPKLHTPTHNVLYNLFKDKETKVLRKSSFDNPTLSQSWFKSVESTLKKVDYLREVCGLWEEEILELLNEDQ